MKNVIINGKATTCFLIPILKNLPNLRCLYIASILAINELKPYHPPDFAKLNNLIYDSFHSKDDKEFLFVFERVKTLQTLELIKSRIDEKFFSFLSKQVNLKELSIKTSGCGDFLKRFSCNQPFTLKSSGFVIKAFTLRIILCWQIL